KDHVEALRQGLGKRERTHQVTHAHRVLAVKQQRRPSAHGATHSIASARCAAARASPSARRLLAERNAFASRLWARYALSSLRSTRNPLLSAPSIYAASRSSTGTCRSSSKSSSARNTAASSSGSPSASDSKSTSPSRSSATNH